MIKIAKKRVNVSLEPRTLSILDQMLKEHYEQNPLSKINRSKLIDHIIQTKCVNPIEYAKDKVREAQKQMDIWHKRLRELENV